MKPDVEPVLNNAMQIRLGGVTGLEVLAQELDQHLIEFTKAQTQPQRVDAQLNFLRWLFSGNESQSLDMLAPRDTSGWKVDPAALDRVQFLVSTLEGSESKRSALRQALHAMLSHCDGRTMFGDAGMPNDRGFLAEISDRLLSRALPRPRNDHDMSDVIYRWLGDPVIAARVQRLSPELFARIAELLCPSAAKADWKFLAQDFADGMQLLALRISAQGLSHKLRTRQPQETVAQSPFTRHARTVERLVEAWLLGNPVDTLLPERSALAQECQARVASIRLQIADQGVSVDIVYGLDVIMRGLAKLESMADMLSYPHGTLRWNLLRRMLIGTTGQIHQDRSVRHLTSENFNLLHVKIIERAGHTGDHYIAESGSAYRHIWLASLGGGLLTTLTVAGKIALAVMPGPALVHGLGYGLNYAASFVAMQHCGFMLATKQPAMTAATLAISLRERDEIVRIEHLVTTTLNIISSQLAATFANIIAVTIGCIGFNFLWVSITDHSYLNLEKASRLLNDLSPVDSLTIFYAALTGVILWSSSLIGGWFDNWSAYHQIPQGIADHAWGERFGRKRLIWLSRAVRRHIAGWGTNISLGMMLGFTPIIGDFLGLPLDVRHVTLNAGMLAMACTTEGLDWWNKGAVVYALFGIACMFVLNLGVSFSLSLLTATRAHRLPVSLLGTLLWRVSCVVIRQPWRVFVPTKATPANTVGG
jgi:site-specific recombinase